MESRPAQFVRGLYFDIQTIEGVQPLEIWNGIREFYDPFEKTALIKNLCKIAVPLVNERCFGRPFEEHSRLVRASVASVISWFTQDAESRLFERFPYPPTGDGDQKELYRMVKAKIHALLEGMDSAEAASTIAKGTGRILSQEVFPDGLFDIREMRLVDNELPYIIFTDKEFRVIHGLVIVYLWLVDLDRVFMETLAENHVTPEIIDEYRQFARKIQKENPLTIHGKKMDAQELLAHIHDKLKYEDYLDLFENVYAWFEETKTKFTG